MGEFLSFKQINGNVIYVNPVEVAFVGEEPRGADGESSMIYFTEKHAVRVVGRAAKTVRKLAGLDEEPSVKAPKKASAKPAKPVAPKK